MMVIFGKCRVKTNSTGWMLQERVGKQWKETKYFSSTKGLVDVLLKEQLHKQTKGLVYYSACEDGAFYLLEEINSRLKAIRDEIVGVLNG